MRIRTRRGCTRGLALQPPIQRSTYAFARGRTRVSSTWMASEAKTVSKASVNFASLSRIRKFTWSTRSSSSIRRSRALRLPKTSSGLVRRLHSCAHGGRLRGVFTGAVCLIGGFVHPCVPGMIADRGSATAVLDLLPGVGLVGTAGALISCKERRDPRPAPRGLSAPPTEAELRGTRRRRRISTSPVPGRPRCRRSRRPGR